MCVPGCRGKVTFALSQTTQRSNQHRPALSVLDSEQPGVGVALPAHGDLRMKATAAAQDHRSTSLGPSPKSLHTPLPSCRRGQDKSGWPELCFSPQTDYFHLFICVAIVAIYGDDVIEQQLATDQMLLHFGNLAMHMNGELVLRKVKGTTWPEAPPQAHRPHPLCTQSSTPKCRPCTLPSPM